MRRFLLPGLVAGLLTLSACAPSQLGGPDYSALSGNYKGTASLGPIPAPYELLLSVNGYSGRADGVLTRTSNGNVYSASGTFRPFSTQGGLIELTLYQGKSNAGTLSARVQSGQLVGTLKARLLSFTLRMQKVTLSAPALPPKK